MKILQGGKAMIAVGVDVHKRQCTVAIQREDGGLRLLEPLENTREGWQELLDQLPPEAEIALEVSTSGYFAMSVLEEAGWRDRAHWVHTAGIESLRKQKYDRLDAKRLARKLSVSHQEPLPEAWFPPPEIRELRLRARERCWLAVLRTQVKNRLQSLLQMHGLRSPTSDLFGAAGRTWLGLQVLPAATRESVDQLLVLHDFLSVQIEKAEAYLRAVDGQFPELARLRTIPGIGPILAPVIWSEIGRLGRFRSARALVNYTGLVPSLYESGEVSIQGGITRQGSTWLRWALVAAANGSLLGVNEFARRYRWLRRRKIAPVAKAAVARALASCVYGVLKSGHPYDPTHRGRRFKAHAKSLGAGQPGVAIGH
jgi:transposase